MFSADRVHVMLDALDAAGVAAVVDGGWGIDALVGRQTREHDDLDLVVEIGHLPQITSALAPLGFRVTLDDAPARVVVALDDGPHVDLHLVTPVAGGGRQDLPGGARFTYPSAAVAGVIAGRDVRCLSADVQLLVHCGYEPDADDHHDVALLQRPLPPPYAGGLACVPAIREATPDDAAAIAVVRSRGWRATYPGLVPDPVLDGMDLGITWMVWHAALSSPSVARTRVAGAAGEVYGFTHSGPSQDADVGPETGELFLLYVDPTAWGSGVGAALLADAVDGVAARGFQQATLWTVRGNARARHFYEREGWAHDGMEKLEEVEGGSWVEVRYRRSLAEPAGSSISSVHRERGGTDEHGFEQ